MTNTEQKALALVRKEDGHGYLNYDAALAALCRAIEQHEAFRQEVSFALKTFKDGNMHTMHDYLLEPFIIPTDEPDPLVKVLNEISHEGGFDNFNHYAHRLRAALDALGFEIREKNGA